jgi:hypothetical protein
MVTSTSSSAGTPTLQAPAPASRETGATPRPSNPLPNPVGEGRGEVSAPWQRLNAAWPTLPESLVGGLDGIAQSLVRHCLTEAAGKRLALHRSLEPESRRIWETRPHLAQYVRQRRFFESLLPHYRLDEFQRLLHTEIGLAVEVLETAPKKLGLETWAALLELQCRRIGQMYAHLRQRMGALAQQELLRAFQGLPGVGAIGRS